MLLMDKTELLTTAQTAVVLGIAEGSVRKLVAVGRLVPQKIGRDNFFARLDIDAYSRDKGRGGWPAGRPRK